MLILLLDFNGGVQKNVFGTFSGQRNFVRRSRGLGELFFDALAFGSFIALYVARYYGEEL